MSEKTTREVLAEQFAAAEEPEDADAEQAAAGDDAGDGEAAADDAGEGGADEENGDAGGEEDGGEADDAEAGAEGERARDDKGKFTREKPREKTPAEKVAEHGKAQKAAEAAAAAAAALPALKAPADWRAAAREQFDKLPRVVQEESIRLHLETKKVLQDSAQARQLADGFQRMVQPYEHILRASGSRSAIEGVQQVVQTYAQLHSAPLPQRAAIIGGLIRDFLGVDEGAINLLAQVLEGKAPAGGGSAPAPGVRPEQIPQLVRQEAMRIQGEAQQQAEAKAITDFEASAPEFLNDVVQEMKAIVTIEKQQGRPITAEMLKAAHEKALRINPTTAAILKQRDDAAAAKKKNEADKLRRKAAASGLKNEPAGPRGNGSKKPKSTREQLAAEFDKAESRERV